MAPGEVNNLVLPGAHGGERESLVHDPHELGVLHELLVLRIFQIPAAFVERGHSPLRAGEIDGVSRLDQRIVNMSDLGQVPARLLAKTKTAHWMLIKKVG